MAKSLDEAYERYAMEQGLVIKPVFEGNKRHLVDSNVLNVKKQLQERSDRGILKYNTTTDRKDLNLKDWLLHLQEELLDAAVYIERIKHETT